MKNIRIKNGKKPMLLCPDWPAPKNIKSCVSTRYGGVSKSPFHSFNMGDHVGDSVSAVQHNRDKLIKQMKGCNKICWLTQTHSVDVVEADKIEDFCLADASFTTTKGLSCAIMTADCLPVLFCNKKGTQVAAAHAGWRGLAEGILVKTLSCFPDKQEVIAWLGPAISHRYFEVGSEVKDCFADYKFAFTLSKNGKWMMDMYAVARAQLLNEGIEAVYGKENCTYREDDWFSYRQANHMDSSATGRMASCIWITP
jgi:YfiH family protein